MYTSIYGFPCIKILRMARISRKDVTSSIVQFYTSQLVVARGTISERRSHMKDGVSQAGGGRQPLWSVVYTLVWSYFSSGFSFNSRMFRVDTSSVVEDFRYSNESQLNFEENKSHWCDTCERRFIPYDRRNSLSEDSSGLCLVIGCVKAVVTNWTKPRRGDFDRSTF